MITIKTLSTYVAKLEGDLHSSLMDKQAHKFTLHGNETFGPFLSYDNDWLLNLYL